jgi:hypothetical protein
VLCSYKNRKSETYKKLIECLKWKFFVWGQRMGIKGWGR